MEIAEILKTLEKFREFQRKLHQKAEQETAKASGRKDDWKAVFGKSERTV